MDTAMKQREVFFNNLLILGFDKAAIEKEYRVTCDRNMFCVPNQKMFEVITFFLFSKLNQVSEKKYSVPWPLMDKDQHRQFQKSCFNHLSSIALESNVKFPRIVSSLLSTFGGDRFYELYLAFSTHVIQRTIIKKSNVSLIMMPTVSHQNSQDCLETLRIATILSVEKFQEIQSFSLSHFKLLLNCAKKFITQIQNLKSSLATNQSLLNENIRILSALYCENLAEKSSLSTILKKALDYEKKVKDLWLPLEKFMVEEKEMWSCLCSEVEDNHEKYILNGTDLNCTVSDSIKVHCPELNKIGNAMDEKNEKLSLFKYLKSFSIILEFYLKILIKGDLSQINELCFIEKSSSLEDSLNHLKILNVKLMTNILPSIKDCTEKLEDVLLLKEFSEDLEFFVKECPSWSCCSKQFQENITGARSKAYSMPFTDDVCNPSLLLGESYSKNSEVTSSKPWFDNSTISSVPQSHSYLADDSSARELPLSMVLHSNRTIDNKSIKPNCSFDSSILQNIDMLPGSPENKTATPGPQSYPCSTKTGNFELDLEYRQPLKLRESFQLEDSLNSMTLLETPDWD